MSLSIHQTFGDLKDFEIQNSRAYSAHWLIVIITNVDTLFQQMEGNKDIWVVVGPCYLAQSFYSCQLSLQPWSLLTAAFFLAWFAAFSRIPSSHGEAYFPIDNE